MAIKCRKTQLANNANAVAPRFNFKTYESINSPFHNNDTDIDFVTYNDSLYVCVNDGARYVAGDPANNGFLLLVAKGTDGRQGIDGQQGPIGPMPELWMRFNGKQLEIGDQTARKAISPDLTGPSWFPELRDKKIVWVRKENGDNSVPSSIDLEALRPLEERPLLLRLDSDNTRRSDEESGPGYYIQWKREGSDHWTNLMSISELMNLALAGCCIWSVTNPDTEKTEYHFGHRQVLRATYDASRLDGGRIAEVELGDVLFDAGAINLPDFEGQIDTLHDMICALDAQIPTLDKEHIVSALGYTPLKEEDINLSKVKLRIDNSDKTLYVSYNGDNGPWVTVGRTCECSPEQSSKIPEFEVFTVTNGNVVRYTNNDYKVSISGDNVTGMYDYGQWPQLVVGEYYNFTVYLPQNLNFVGSPTGAKRFTGESIQLFANKAVTKYTVTITKSPANAVVKVNGVTYSSPIQVNAGDVINVKATASGYEDWSNSYTINSNQTIAIQMHEKESAETSTSCVVTINSITPSNAVVYYDGQQVHVGDTFTVSKGSSMRFTGPAISGYNALDKDYRIYYNDTQSLDIVFDAEVIPSLSGYYDVTINCNVSDATITVNSVNNEENTIIVGNKGYSSYLLESVPQIIKVKGNAQIIVTGIRDGYNSDQISKRITGNTTINLQLTSKSTVDYSDHLLIFKSAIDDNGDPIQAPVTVVYSDFYTLGSEAENLQDILNRQNAGEYLHVNSEPALTVMAFADGYEPYLEESFEFNSDGNLVITPVLEKNSGTFFWITPLDHLLDNHSTYVSWDEVGTNEYDCVPVIGSAGYYRIAILCASSDTVSVSYTGDVTRTNATTYAYYNDSFDQHSNFDRFGILFVTGYVSQAGTFAEVNIASNGITKVVNLKTDVTPTPNRINFNIPNDISGLNITAKINDEAIEIPLSEEVWVANNTVLNVVATSNNYLPINTGDLTINDNYTLVWQKSTEPAVVTDPISLNYTANGGDKLVSVSTFNFEGTPTISAEITNNSTMFADDPAVNGNSVTISVAPNSGAQRTGTIRVTAEYQSTSAYADVSITQDANENPVIRVSNIEMSPKHIGDTTQGDNAFAIGETAQLYATVLPSNATDKRVTWVSDDPSIVNVDSSGLITGVELGTTFVRATSVDNSAFSDTCTITVSEETASYTISVNSNTPSGESYTIYADGGPVYGNRFEGGTEIEVITTSNNYTATVSPGSWFVLESNTIITITWTPKSEPVTYYTISYDTHENSDGEPASYEVLVDNVPIDSGDQFVAGAEISISVTTTDDETYDTPEIYIDGTEYDGGEFIINDNVMCLIKWIKKKYSATVTNNSGYGTIYMAVVGDNWEETNALTDLENGTTVHILVERDGYEDIRDYDTIDGDDIEFVITNNDWHEEVVQEGYCATWTNESSAEDEDITVKFAIEDDDWENVSESNELCGLETGDTVYLHIERGGYEDIDMSYTIDDDDYEFEITNADWIPSRLVFDINDTSLDYGDTTSFSLYCSGSGIDVTQDATYTTDEIGGESVLYIDSQRQEISVTSTPPGNNFEIEITATYTDNYNHTITGTATITIVNGGSQTVSVTGVSVSPSSLEMAVGEPDETLTATIIPANATNQNVSWSSSNSNVASVDNDGVVTAVYEGNATITATTADGSYTDTCDVTVWETRTWTLDVVSDTPNGESYTVYVDGGPTQSLPNTYESGVEVEVQTTSNNYTATVSPASSFTLEANTTITITWTAK